MGHHPRHHRHLLPLVLSALLLRPRHPRLHHTRRDLARALPPRFLSHSKSPKILGINGKRHPMFCSSDHRNNNNSDNNNIRKKRSSSSLNLTMYLSNDILWGREVVARGKGRGGKEKLCEYNRRAHL